jgi:nucleoside-diphosphate-sugar epimerase
MNKIFIAGDSGFIDSNLCRAFSETNSEVFVFDSNIQYFYPMTKYSIKNMEYRYKFLLNKVKIIRGNTLDICDLRRSINEIKPNYIINLAALPLATTSVKNSEEAFTSILETTKNFLEIIKDFNFIKKYVHISSSIIYGNFQKNPNPENSLKEPIEIYGSFKLASEYIVKGYSKRYGINSVIVRPSAVYGPTDNNLRVIQKFIQTILDKGKIVVSNPKKNFLDFTYVKDIAEGIKLATLTKTSNLEIFNITRGEGRSLYEVLEILKKRLGKFEVQITSDSGINPKRGALDITRARKILKFKPRFSLEDGIEDYLLFLKNL